MGICVPYVRVIYIYIYFYIQIYVCLYIYIYIHIHIHSYTYTEILTCAVPARMWKRMSNLASVSKAKDCEEDGPGLTGEVWLGFSGFRVSSLTLAQGRQGST